MKHRALVYYIIDVVRYSTERAALSYMRALFLAYAAGAEFVGDESLGSGKALEVGSSLWGFRIGKI